MLAKLADGDYEESTDKLEEWIGQFDAQLGSFRNDIAALGRDINNKRLEGEALKEQYTRVSR